MMFFEVQFEEQEQRLPCDFGEVREIMSIDVYNEGYREGETTALGMLEGSITELKSRTNIADGELKKVNDALEKKQDIETHYNWLQNGCLAATRHGVTSVINTDKSITLNGTCTGETNDLLFYYNMRTGATSVTDQYDNYQLLPPGDYIISGGINGKTSFQICTSRTKSKVQSSQNFGASGAFTIPDGVPYVWVRFRIAKGAFFDNETVYPMIRRADEEDDTYQPYKMTTEERITRLEELYAVLAAAENE